MVIIAIGVVLVLLGLGGAIGACTTNPSEINLVQVTLAGLSMGIGLVAIAIGAARHGYHRRPLGSPPGDTDPDKVSDPARGKL